MGSCFLMKIFIGQLNISVPYKWKKFPMKKNLLKSLRSIDHFFKPLRGHPEDFKDFEILLPRLVLGMKRKEFQLVNPVNVTVGVACLSLAYRLCELTIKSRPECMLKYDTDHKIYTHTSGIHQLVLRCAH